MFIIDQPFVSDFLVKTIKENSIPVVNFLETVGLDSITDQHAIELFSKKPFPALYTNSENAIDWINKNLSFSSLPNKIALFKDKYKFRQLIQPLYPDFFFESVSIDNLESVNFDCLPLPFIIKPSVGFFSMAVYKVNSIDEWRKTIASIRQEMQSVKGLYPSTVMGEEQFIIEQCIDGDEYAVDAYVDEQGEAVVLSILKHTFASQDDVSDRVYTTSKEIIVSNLAEFTDFIQQITELSQVKNFPMHVELRRAITGELFPIEVNPMRFGGWCTTADMAFYAYGFNQYLYYYNQQKPDWSKLLEGKDDKLYSIIVLDNSTGKNANQIEKFDFDKVLKGFENVLESRVIDYRSYPLFGFLFVETDKNNTRELNYILQSDLNEYIQT